MRLNFLLNLFSCFYKKKTSIYSFDRVIRARRGGGGGSKWGKTWKFPKVGKRERRVKSEEKLSRLVSRFLFTFLQENPPTPREDAKESKQSKTLKIDRLSANICREWIGAEQQPSLTFNYLMTLSIIQSMFTRICYTTCSKTFQYHLFFAPTCHHPPSNYGLWMKKYSDLVVFGPFLFSLSLKTMNFHSLEK